VRRQTNDAAIAKELKNDQVARIVDVTSTEVDRLTAGGRGESDVAIFIVTHLHDRCL
jgi:hypothetical protein